jgi:hypothetical protein
MPINSRNEVIFRLESFRFLSGYDFGSQIYMLIMPIYLKHEGFRQLESSWFLSRYDLSFICTCPSCQFTRGMRDLSDSNHLGFYWDVIRVSYVLVHHADLLEAWGTSPTWIILVFTEMWFESHMYLSIMTIYSRHEGLLRLESFRFLSRCDSSHICLLQWCFAL